MRKPVPLLTAALLLAPLSAPAADKPAPKAPAAAVAPAVPATDEEKTIYALGVAISRNLAPFRLTAPELELLKTGLTDGVLDRQKSVDVDAFLPKISELARSRQTAAAAEEKAASQAFLEKAAAEPGAKKTASGLIFRELVAGTGDSPTAADRVKVHYHGTLRDGTVFDSSRERGQPATFPLSGVIRCWTEGVQMMKPGGKAVLVCPSDIAYGDSGAGGKIKPGAALQFEVELLEVEKTPPPAAPGSPGAAVPPPAPSATPQPKG